MLQRCSHAPARHAVASAKAGGTSLLSFVKATPMGPATGRWLQHFLKCSKAKQKVATRTKIFLLLRDLRLLLLRQNCRLRASHHRIGRCSHGPVGRLFSPFESYADGTGHRPVATTQGACAPHGYSNSWIRRLDCSGEIPRLRNASGPSPVCNTGSRSSRLSTSVRRQNNPIGISSPH